MRLSIHDDDPGYNWRLIHRRPKAYLDGQSVDGVVTADEETGMILRHKLDRDGNVQLNREKTEVLTERLYGKVEIVFEKGLVDP